MAHVLAQLIGVKLSDIEDALKRDASLHAEQGLYLEQLWQNADIPDEVLFLFRADDLEKAKRFIEKIHAEARVQDPAARLPHMTFLR